MKRIGLQAAIVLAALSASAQAYVDTAALKAYVTKALTRCPASEITMEPVPAQAQGPAGFRIYTVTQKSSDQYCGGQKLLLYSPTSQQTVLGSVFLLPADSRPLELRVAEQATQLLKKQMTATIAPFPLPDGLRSVSINKQTEHGPFSYHGFVDQSQRFLIVGARGALNSDPGKTLLDSLGVGSGARRGAKTPKVDIVELSDFQCPTCARAHKKVEPIVKANLDKIRYTRLDLPLFEHHEWSIPAALGARAIQRIAPAKYWTYVDYIFENQEQIGKMKFDDVIRNFSEDNDIPWAAIEPIYRSRSERLALLEQVSRAFDSGIVSTPTFIVNGQIMGFGPEGSFTIESIKNALGTSSPKSTASKTKKSASKKK